jgi:hypothetical protein
VTPRAWRWAAATMVLLPLAACLTRRDRSQVDAWLHCIECSDGEADSLRALGARKRTATVRQLRDDLLAGPSAARRHHVQEQFRETYQALKKYASLHVHEVPDITATQADFVRGYLDNYLALYRVRAAVGLARVGGSAAVPVIDSALQGNLTTPLDSLRDDVRFALEYARDSIAP